MFACRKFWWGLLPSLWLGLGSPGLQADDLLIAIKADNLGKVQELLAADPAALNRPIKFHNFPLHVAVEKLKPEIVRYLVEQGAKVNALDDRGESAMFKLVRLEVRSEKRFNLIKGMFQVLCDHQAEVKQPNRDGETPLYLLAGRQFGRTTMPFKLELMKLLIAQGASPKDQDRAATPLLLYVLKKLDRDEFACINVIETIKFLVEHGALVDAADKSDGDTAMIRIIKTKAFSLVDKSELIIFLIDHGASIRHKNQAKESPQRLVDRHHPLYESIKHRPTASKR